MKQPKFKVGKDVYVENRISKTKIIQVSICNF